jgi:hypothetical protein
MTYDEVQQWLSAYLAAWRGYDPDQIAALFAEEATYAYQPWAEPLRGRDAIVADWLEDPDPPGSWEASYRPLSVEDNRATATGQTRYADGKTYWNLFVMAFNDDRQCTDFVEWYMLHP